MKLFRVVLVGLSVLIAACSSADETTEVSAGKPMVKYSYTGPAFSVFTGAVPPWTSDSQMSGYFIAEELPPMTTTDFLDPDIHWPFPHIPEEFAFSDGARTITRPDLEDVMKITGDRLDPNKHEVRAFSVTTGADGNIIAWDILFVHDVRRNTFLSAYNGGIYGQDLTEVDATHFGCVATEKCTANANYSSGEPRLPDTQPPGTWTKEIVGASADAEEEVGI